ncbi:MAG: carboxy-terminal-processing protease, carboxyl-terminal processing protease [Candidatus Parcubacteria bacterium]|jgi:carboxyl-terminal processing protease
MKNFVSSFNQSKKTVRIALVTGLIVVLFGAGMLAGQAMSERTARTDGKLDSQLLGLVQESINNKFVFWKASSTLPTDKELEYGMIQGYVAAYKDPYTVFFPPEEAKSFAENVQGSFGGVGMNVGMKEGAIVIIAPLKDSPAMKAGIKSGDIITGIDGKNAMGMNSEEAVRLIRGKIGTNVTLSVIHPNEKAPVDITITREEIKIPTIDTEKKDGVFIIHLYNFSSESPDLFRKALVEFNDSNYKYMIIDLRGNPGGYLEAAVNMASYFLQEGQVVVSERQGKEENVLNHRSYGLQGLSKDISVVVLADGGSASASEILAGALKDHGVAKIVGEKTFGKGSVQELVNFPDGSSLKVTIAKWFTPDGVNISESGIKPDVTVSFGTTTPKTGADGKPIDPQLMKAIEVVKGAK